MRDELAAIIANYVGGKTKAADEKRANMLDEVMALVDSIEPVEMTYVDATVRATETMRFGAVWLEVDSTGTAQSVTFEPGWEMKDYRFAG